MSCSGPPVNPLVSHGQLGQVGVRRTTSCLSATQHMLGLGPVSATPGHVVDMTSLVSSEFAEH